MSPFAAGSIEMTPPHFAPAGSLAQFVSSRYGFGALPLWAAMVTTASRSAAATRTDFTRRDCGMWSSKEMRADCSRIGALHAALAVLPGLTRTTDDAIVVVGGRAGRMSRGRPRDPRDGRRAI